LRLRAQLQVWRLEPLSIATLRGRLSAMCLPLYSQRLCTITPQSRPHRVSICLMQICSLRRADSTLSRDGRYTN